MSRDERALVRATPAWEGVQRRLRTQLGARETGNAGPWLLYLVGGAFAAAGVWALVLAADRRFLFDRTAATVRIVVQRLAHRTTDQYAIADLKDVALERSAGASRQSSPSFRLVFLTKAGGRVPWTPYSTIDEGALAACASAVRGFCGWSSPTTPASPPSPGTGGVSGHPVATNWGCAGIFLAVFVALGIGLFASEVYRVYAWQPVTARVVFTDIKAVRGNKGTSYAPIVRYDYSFDEQPYQSDHVLPITISASYGWAQRLRDRFHPGQIVTAYVDPRRPSNAFLVREVSHAAATVRRVPPGHRRDPGVVRPRAEAAARGNGALSGARSRLGPGIAATTTSGTR
jgi:Protein of unknown function (DUF3592)